MNMKISPNAQNTISIPITAILIPFASPIASRLNVARMYNLMFTLKRTVTRPDCLVPSAVALGLLITVLSP